MARQIRRFGPYVLVFGVLIGLAALLVPAPGPASAATYIDPWWTNSSPSIECGSCGCGCPRPAEWADMTVNDGWSGLDVDVNNRTGEALVNIALGSFPGRLEGFGVGITLRSYISGGTQVGGDAILSIEHTLQEEIINPLDPDSEGGTEVYWRQPGGGYVTFVADGFGGFTTDDCSVQHTLTHNSPYKLTDNQGNEMLFDANGMPDKYTDRNGNELDFTYNGSFQITGLTDTRGKSWSFSHDEDGYLDQIQDPAGTTYALDYDANGYLVSVDLPATTDQPSGSTITLTRDGNSRITDIQDGRGNTVYEFAYVGSTPKVATATIDGEDESFLYAGGVTTRTDRNGNVHRTHYTGQNITQRDMYIDSQAEYVTTYTYNGSNVVTIVYPRGNRVDFTWDGNDNLTERRHKLTDTASNNATDLVHTWAYTNNFVTSYTDPESNQTVYGRDAVGNVTSITYPTVTSPSTQAASKAIEYNTEGQVITVTDEEGKETDYTYFATGQNVGLLQKIEVDPEGLDLETVFDYDSSGNVTSRTDPRGNETTFLWDARRRLKQRVADPSGLGYTTNYEYDANGNRTEVEVKNIDKDGDDVTANLWLTTTFTYTDLNRVATTVEETGPATTRTTTFTYDAKGNRIRVTKPEGNKTKWDYDERDLVSAITRGETATEESVSEYAYDDNGNFVTMTDGRDNDTTHTYDMFDRRTKTTDPLGHYTEWTFDKNGRVTQISRKNSSDTELQQRNLYYDERGRQWKTSDVHKDPGTTYSNAVTTIERFKTGRVKTVTDPRSNDTDYTYDNAWRTVSVTDAMGNETTWTLDANGSATEWSIEEVHSGGTVTHEYEASYDILNRRTSYREIDRNDSENVLETTYGYDSRGNLVWRVNAKGDPTRWTFDEAGRMVKKEVALATGSTIEDFTSAIVTEWAFDDNDRLTSHKDDAGNESTWSYDALDRATSMAYPDTETVSYEYDDNSNVTEITDPNGSVIADTYDDNNRRTARSVTRGTGVLGTTSETFTYDGVGRMTKAGDNDYKVEFTYGVIGLASQVYEEKQSYVGATAYLKTVTKTYDAVGNKITEDYPSSLDLDYTWNDINRLSTVTDGTNTMASYDYIGVRPEQVTFQNGTTSSYAYTGFRDEVSQIHHETSDPTTILDLRYGYDENHDRTYERYGASADGDAFEYDTARRLTSAWMGSDDVTDPASNPYVKKIEYNMDDDGNRSSVVVTPYGQSADTTSYTDNSLNQYTAVGSSSRTHDDNGNLFDDGTYDFEYDYKNLIVRVKEDTTTIAEYKYDALGRRVEKDDQSTVRRYIYSGHETVCVYDGSDVIQQSFVFGSLIDEVLVLEQADVLDFDEDENTTEATRSFYHRNALGSVMEITEMDEDVAVSYRYDPYGAVTIIRNSTPQSSDPLGNPCTYTGRFLDEETGLYYYRARAYSHVTGRFLQRDPLGYVSGPSLYPYARSRPAVLTDPSGMRPPSRPPQPGGSGGAGRAGNGERGDSVGRNAQHRFSYSWYFWATNGSATGLWVKSAVVVTYTELGRSPYGDPVPDLPERRTVEYWKMGRRRSKVADTHADSVPADLCKGKVTVTMTLQFGTLKVKGADGEFGKPKGSHVTESTNYDTRGGTNEPIGADNIQFEAVGGESTWTYSWTWDDCRARDGGRCGNRHWRSRVRPKPQDITPRPPPVITPR